MKDLELISVCMAEVSVCSVLSTFLSPELLYSRTTSHAIGVKLGTKSENFAIMRKQELATDITHAQGIK